MTPAQRICYVFECALRGKSDDKFVKVQATDLITAFGADVAKKEFAVDTNRINDVIQAATVGRTAELEHEIGELTEMVDAGFQDARKQLKASRRELADINSGKLVPKPLISVQVGQLRKLSAEKRSALKQAALAAAGKAAKAGKEHAAEK